MPGGEVIEVSTTPQIGSSAISVVDSSTQEIIQRPLWYKHDNKGGSALAMSPKTQIPSKLEQWLLNTAVKMV